MALNYKIIYTDLALESVKSIHDYLENDLDTDIADRITARTSRFISALSYNPFIGRVVDFDEYETKEKDVRRITTLDKRYNIYYRADEQARIVYILKIADGKQSIDRQLSGL